MVEGWVVSPFIEWGTFDLANNTKMCYTYDELSRVTKRTLVNLSDNTETVEEYTYDAAGNITSSEADIDVTFSYDTNNRLASADGVAVTYDLDGNMTFASVDGTSYSGTFDSHNRLISMRGHTYTYDVQSVRIKDLCDDVETTFVYDTNSKLSKLLVKTTGDVTTKYVYGRGLIGEESSNTFKIYHYDYRGSTIAITDTSGAVTDTFAYDTYGKRIARTGSTDTPFQYDGRDGVVTDETGLLYMRARYYCPDLRRFINADIIAGDISNAITLNRYAYANGNPVSNIDPFGLSAERGWDGGSNIYAIISYMLSAIESKVYELMDDPEYMEMYRELTMEDIRAGITIKEIGGQYYYDYTEPVMERLNEVMPGFIAHDILTYSEYVDEYSAKICGINVVSPTYKEYLASMLVSLLYFYNQVDHGKPWDIKVDASWTKQFGNLRMPFYCGEDEYNEHFVFRDEVVSREDLGNITYGYLGSAMGIGDETLYWGGGVATQGKSSIFSDVVRDPDRFYGDMENDHFAIKKGIDWYYEDYPNSKPGINGPLPY